MCFDMQSSLLGWTLAYSISVFLYYRNQNYDRWNAAFIICFSTIQFLEAGLWLDIDSPSSNNGNINDLLTRLILLTLLAQPLVQNYMGYINTKEPILMLTSFVFLGGLVWAGWRVGTSKPGQFSSAPGPNGHLVWSDSKSPNFLGGIMGMIYVAGLFIPLFFMKEWKGAALIAIGVITAVLSLMFTSKGEFASYWCYAAVLYAIVALFV